MSDSPEAPPEHQFNITREQFSRFFKEKWKLSQCEVCLASKGNWKLAPAEAAYSVLVATNGKSINPLGTQAHVVANVHCSNCGNMKFLLAPVIRAWLEQNK